MTGLVSRIIPGPMRASDDLVNERMNICRACEFRSVTIAYEKCTACGCLLATKTALKQQKCPKGKW